jgi:hypothetical protein
MQALVEFIFILAQNVRVFNYGTQYQTVPPVEKNLYAIKKDLHVRICQLTLILYHRFFLCGVGGIHRWYGSTYTGIIGNATWYE